MRRAPALSSRPTDKGQSARGARGDRVPSPPTAALLYQTCRADRSSRSLGKPQIRSSEEIADKNRLVVVDLKEQQTPRLTGPYSFT